ncbi:hypothetical protein E8E13_007820 [Curvularia kusanoi]|uniref:Uncharacterized protein n=1 Tax=Curvularia kusanoi TaxID=90978 RepID=A0A9P4TPQ9_CURKU|nr:hypothetical protein E8E13_007820 [Curvularia kusanoi]
MRLAAEWLPLFLFYWAGGVEAAGSLTINGPDDITKLNQCTTFDGNISVAATGTTDLALNGLKAITGTLSVADSDAVLSISSATLESVSTLSLSNLTNLATLTLPALGNMTKLSLSYLGSLRGCEIATQGLKQDISEVTVFSTAIEKLDWLKWPVASTLNIAVNRNLTDFAFPYSTINAGSTYQLSGNYALDNLNLSQLTGIAGSLALSGNGDKDLQFDRLESIDGYVKLDGAYSNITMPRLVSINGALRASSTIDILSFCNWLSIQNRLLGHYDCTANNTNPAPVVTSTASMTPLKTSGTTPSGASLQTGTSNKSDLSTGAIIGIAMGMVVLISIILTSLALLFLRRRSQKKQALQAVHEKPAPENKKTHSSSTLGEELDASGVRYELGGGHAEQTHELPEAKPVTELDGQSFQELESEKPFFRDHKPAPESPIGRFELP